MATCNAAHIRHLLAVAHHHATRNGLSSDDADDCALTFVEAHFASTPPPSIRCPEAWWNTCARRHVLSYKRALTRRGRHECPWPEPADLFTAPTAFDPPSDAPDPENALLQNECWQKALELLSELTKEQCSFWVRHRLLREPIESLARSAGKTPEAVRKTLHRADKRLRVSLQEAGWTQVDVCHCLLPPAQAPGLPTRTY